MFAIDIGERPTAASVQQFLHRYIVFDSPSPCHTTLPNTNYLSFTNHSHAPYSFESFEFPFVYEWELQLMADPLAP